MAERTQRYTESERAGQRANLREMFGKAKYGGSFEQQGKRPIKEQGKHALYAAELQQKYGAFANPTWQYEERGGVLYRKPYANQVGRIAEQGGTAQWEAAPDYVQRAYQNPQRRAWNAAHPEAASRPGGGRDQFLFERYTGGLPIDPATGLRVNPQGELYDPSMFGRPGYTGGSIGMAGQMPGGFGQPGGDYRTGGGFMAPGGPPPMPGYGSYGQPGGYIPGYAQPWSMQSYGMPQYQGGNLGMMGGMNQAPRVNMPNYRTLQQQGGSSFGMYQPRWSF